MSLGFGFFFFQSDANNVFGVIIIVLRFCTICGKHVSRQRDITCHHTTIVGPFPDTWYQMSLCNLLKPDLKLTESSVYWYQISCHFLIEIYCINYVIWVICLALWFLLIVDFRHRQRWRCWRRLWWCRCWRASSSSPACSCWSSSMLCWGSFCLARSSMAIIWGGEARS